MLGCVDSHGTQHDGKQLLSESSGLLGALVSSAGPPTTPQRVSRKLGGPTPSERSLRRRAPASNAAHSETKQRTQPCAVRCLARKQGSNEGFLPMEARCVGHCIHCGARGETNRLVAHASTEDKHVFQKKCMYSSTIEFLVSFVRLRRH